MYRDQGKPTVAWIATVSTRRALEELIRSGREVPLDWEPVGSNPEPADPFVARIIRECLDWIARKKQQYRLLLELWADGYKIREMIPLANYRPGDNKKVFNHLQQARKWLLQCLKRKGIT
jgi:hypothetical protein